MLGEREFFGEPESLITGLETDFSVAARRNERANAEKESLEDQGFAKLLDLFGSTEARSRFVGLCEMYVEHYHTSSSSDEENTRTTSKIRRLESKRSDAHNQIMETLRKLIAAQKFDSPAYALLEKFQDRKRVEAVLMRGNWKEM